MTNTKYHYEDTEDEKFKPILPTGQTSLLLPTECLLKIKKTDFRVLGCISWLSNCDNIFKKGGNTKYVSLEKVDRYMEKICEGLKIDVKTFNRQVRNLLKHKSEEFKLIKKEHNGKLIDCYEINYTDGKYITIPLQKAEKVLFGLGNNSIKLYANLLWLCWDSKKRDYVPRELTQSFLLNLIGLSESSDKLLKIATETLTECGFIDVEYTWKSKTIVNKNNIPIGTKPTKILTYSIKLD